MGRFIRTGLLFLFTCFMGCYAWFYAIKPELEGNTNFLSSEEPAINVTIPLGGTLYIDIKVDGINTELEATNNLTTWRFNDALVVRTKDKIEGKPYKGHTYYTSNRQVYGVFNDYYVSVASNNRLVGISADSILTAEPYEAPCPIMDETNQITEIPHESLPEDYDVTGEWKLPKDVEEIVMSQSVDDKSYYKGDWYFNYNFRYQKHNDAVVDAATRVCALSHADLDWWYDDGTVFIAKAGNEYASVKQSTYTSCYYISSNDLSYILLNL